MLKGRLGSIEYFNALQCIDPQGLVFLPFMYFFVKKNEGNIRKEGKKLI